MSFFDQPARVTRFKLVHAVWGRQRMDLLPGVAPGVAAVRPDRFADGRKVTNMGMYPFRG